MKKTTRKVKLLDLVTDAFQRRDPVAFELRERLLKDGMAAEVEVIECTDDSEDRKAAKLEMIKRRAKAHEEKRERQISA